MDRVGRMMVDISPHIAMLGKDLGSFGNQHNLSTATQNGSVSNNNLGLFDRFNNQLGNTTILYTQNNS